MENVKKIKETIIEYRKFIHQKAYILPIEGEMTSAEIREKAELLKEKAFEALSTWEDKEAAAKFWNNQMTGNYDG